MPKIQKNGGLWKIVVSKPDYDEIQRLKTFLETIAVAWANDANNPSSFKVWFGKIVRLLGKFSSGNLGRTGAIDKLPHP